MEENLILIKTDTLSSLKQILEVTKILLSQGYNPYFKILRDVLNQWFSVWPDTSHNVFYQAAETSSETIIHPPLLPTSCQHKRWRLEGWLGLMVGLNSVKHPVIFSAQHWNWTSAVCQWKPERTHPGRVASKCEPRTQFSLNESQRQSVHQVSDWVLSVSLHDLCSCQTLS